MRVFGKSTQSKSLWSNRNAAKDEQKWNFTSSVMGLWKQTMRHSTDATIFHCNKKKEGIRNTKHELKGLRSICAFESVYAL